MINNLNLYLLFLFSFIFLIYLILNFRPSNDELSNKIILKKLLEGLDMDIPEELKSLNSSPTDNQKLK